MHHRRQKKTKSKRKRRKQPRIDYQQWQEDAQVWQEDATTKLIHANAFLFDRSSRSIQNDTSFAQELLALGDLLLQASPQKLTHEQRKRNTIEKVRQKMRRAQLSSCDKPPTKLDPSFLGVRRGASTRTVPPTLKRWLKKQPHLAPILRATVSDRSSEFPTGNLIQTSKKKKTLTGDLLGQEEGVPHWTRHDWGGGLSAGEFALPKPSKHTRLKIPELSIEMKNKLKNMIDNNLGEDLWNDRVGSRLARPLNSKVFCSMELQQQQYGSGIQYSEQGMNYYAGAGVGGFVEHQIEQPPSRSSTVQSVATARSSLGTPGDDTLSRVGTPGTLPRTRTPGTPGTPLVPGTPGKSCKWSRESLSREGMSRKGLGTPPIGRVRSRRARTTTGERITGSSGIRRTKDHSNAALWSNFQPMAPDTAFSLSIVPLTTAQMNYKQHRFATSPPTLNNAGLLPEQLSQQQELHQTTRRPRTVPTALPSNQHNTLAHVEQQARNRRRKRIHTPLTPGSAGTSGRHLYSSGSMNPGNLPLEAGDRANHPGTHRYNTTNFRGLSSRESLGGFSVGSMESSSVESLHSSLPSSTPLLHLTLQSTPHTTPHSARSTDTNSDTDSISTDKRPIYSSGSMPTTFRSTLDNHPPHNHFHYRRPMPTPPLLSPQDQHDRLPLPRGLSRQLVAFSYQRFPYGSVAHWAANTLQRSVRRWQLYKHDQLTKVQSLVRQWKAKQFTTERRETYEAALTVLQRQARVFIAKLKVLWMRHARRGQAARLIQSLHRGNAGRIDAEKWRQFVIFRSARLIQKTWHGACGRARFRARHRWKRNQLMASILIESCWRGYHYGRLRVYRIKMWSAMELQRVIRGWLGRVKAVRQVLYRAANDIQRTLYHGIVGRRKATTVYQQRVEHEIERRQKENKLVQTEVQKQVALVTAMLSSQDQRAMKNKAIKRAKKSLAQAYKKALRVRTLHAKTDDKTTLHIKRRLLFGKRYQIEKIFKSYDLTGTSGCIPLDSLPELLNALCIPLTSGERNKVKNILQRPERLQSDGVHDAAGYEIMQRDAAMKKEQADAEVAGGKRKRKKKETMVIRFEDFWELYTTSLGGGGGGGGDGGDAVSEGDLSHRAVQRLRTKLQITKIMHTLIGKHSKERAIRWLKEEARIIGTENAMVKFRVGKQNSPPFHCKQCLRPFVFDYEVARHQEKTDQNCKAWNVYDSLRQEAFDQMKTQLEEEDVLALAKAEEFKQFEKFRRPGMEEKEDVPTV